MVSWRNWGNSTARGIGHGLKICHMRIEKMSRYCSVKARHGWYEVDGIENDVGNGSPSSEPSRREERRMQWEKLKTRQPLVKFDCIVEEGCHALVSSKNTKTKTKPKPEKAVSTSASVVDSIRTPWSIEDSPRERHPPCNPSKHNRGERAYVHTVWTEESGSQSIRGTR